MVASGDILIGRSIFKDNGIIIMIPSVFNSLTLINIDFINLISQKIQTKYPQTVLPV